MSFVDDVQRELDAANRGPRMVRNVGCSLVVVAGIAIAVFVVTLAIILAKAIS